MKYKACNKAFAIQHYNGTGGLSIWADGKKEFIPIDDTIPDLSRKIAMALEAAYLAGKNAKADEIKSVLDL